MDVTNHLLAGTILIVGNHREEGEQGPGGQSNPIQPKPKLSHWFEDTYFTGPVEKKLFFWMQRDGDVVNFIVFTQSSL